MPATKAAKKATKPAAQNRSRMQSPKRAASTALSTARSRATRPSSAIQRERKQGLIRRPDRPASEPARPERFEAQDKQRTKRNPMRLRPRIRRTTESRSRLQSPSRKRNEADARKASDRSRLQAPKSAASKARSRDAMKKRLMERFKPEEERPQRPTRQRR